MFRTLLQMASLPSSVPSTGSCNIGSSVTVGSRPTRALSDGEVQKPVGLYLEGDGVLVAALPSGVTSSGV
jgi:hypothetical protein